MTETAKLHLKEWLIRQIDSGRYEGLSWEDEEKTMFRIPWKHAAKKDYKQTEDAALFKAWAVYKGKYREGRDKADPTMWKTRLRCALNKSTDFQEVAERNQLDITEPYKVYRIQGDSGSTRPAEAQQVNVQMIIQAKTSPAFTGFGENEVCREKKQFHANKDENLLTKDLLKEHMYCELTGKNPIPAPLPLISPASTDFRMHVKLFYQGQCVMKMTTTSQDGCFILQGCVPVGNERIYGPCTAQQLSFPSPASASLPTSIAAAMDCLLHHLERGVLLWAAPDGVFIKRFCQGRVYWSGPMAQHTDRPNKLEREKTFKLLDIPRFVSELQSCLQGKGPIPLYKIDLCFGEEYPDPSNPKTKKLIMAQVVPVFAVSLLQRFGLGESEERQSDHDSNTEGENM
ncbi:interferon regulatory factor 10 [Echeneis naucrates]|uniref:Interferon regulatory factor 4-like n=1 Tax=Echeneis naucrates TaxID=173247 RepID=A0A665VMD1_ECHNA|nr:interferon regulatory factor 4-like [Echeneis naucrates]